MNKPAELEQNYQERILKTLVYIQNHLNDELSLEQLSAVANFSPFHFHRFFLAYTGETLQGYVRRLRLERAAKDLAFKCSPISLIADNSGFQTVQSFHHAFKKMFNETPSLYREKQLEITKLVLLSDDDQLKNKAKTVSLQKRDPIDVLFTRAVGVADDTELMKIWFKLITAASIPVFMSEKTQRISVFHDCKVTTPLAKFRYDASITRSELPHDFQPEGNVGLQTIPGGLYAVIRHHGSLKGIDTTLRVLYRLWLPESGYEPIDSPSFAIHQNLPFQTPEDELLTDIYLPVALQQKLY
jgi:AraC family transcriptional regulator